MKVSHRRVSFNNPQRPHLNTVKASHNSSVGGVGFRIFRSLFPSVGGVGFRVAKKPNISSVGGVGFRVKREPGVGGVGFRVSRTPPPSTEGVDFRVTSTPNQVKEIGVNANLKNPSPEQMGVNAAVKSSPANDTKPIYLSRDLILVALVLINSIGEFLYHDTKGDGRKNIQSAWKQLQFTYYHPDKFIVKGSRFLQKEEVRHFDAMIRRSATPRDPPANFVPWVLQPRLKHLYGSHFLKHRDVLPYVNRFPTRPPQLAITKWIKTHKA